MKVVSARINNSARCAGESMDDQETMSRGDRDRARVFGLGLVIGAVAGAAAGLLLAPSSGEQTRRMLRKGARRAYKRTAGAVGDAWSDADRNYRKLSRNGIKRARRQAERARSLAEDFVGKKRFSWR
jgi:gas vesicle protein